MPLLRLAAGAALLILLAAAAQQSLVASGVLTLGAMPGEEARGTRIVEPALLVMAAWGTLLLIAAPLRRPATALRSRVVSMLPFAAVLFVLARFSAYDPYFLPDLRRMWSGGVASPTWVVAVVAVGVLVGLAWRGGPRGTAAARGPALWLCALTAGAAGLGH